jgi:hypothetical protein
MKEKENYKESGRSIGYKRDIEAIRTGGYILYGRVK